MILYMLVLYFYDSTKNNNGTEYYCHVEDVQGANGLESIGYLIKFETDNQNNYKYINILNWIFGDIKTVSF